MSPELPVAADGGHGRSARKRHRWKRAEERIVSRPSEDLLAGSTGARNHRNWIANVASDVNSFYSPPVGGNISVHIEGIPNISTIVHHAVESLRISYACSGNPASNNSTRSARRLSVGEAQYSSLPSAPYGTQSSAVTVPEIFPPHPELVHRPLRVTCLICGADVKMPSRYRQYLSRHRW